MIGIICAMPEECAGFDGLSRARQILDDGFTRLSIGERDVVIANRGLGKVQAAMTATLMIERFGCRALVCAGTAGGLEGVAAHDVLVASRLIQHDYGRSRGPGQIELYRPGVPPLPEHLGPDVAFDLPHTQRVAYASAGSRFDFLRFGTYASGDSFVNDSETRDRLIGLGAQAVDMESAAVVQVAESFGLPWLVAKGISDDASAMSHEAFLEGLAEAARRSAQVVAALLPRMPLAASREHG